MPEANNLVYISLSRTFDYPPPSCGLPPAFLFSLVYLQHKNRKYVIEEKIYCVIYLFDGKSNKIIRNRGGIKRPLQIFLQIPVWEYHLEFFLELLSLAPGPSLSCSQSLQIPELRCLSPSN